jgi:hypothetical protein
MHLDQRCSPDASFVDQYLWYPTGRSWPYNVDEKIHRYIYNGFPRTCILIRSALYRVGVAMALHYRFEQPGSALQKGSQVSRCLPSVSSPVVSVLPMPARRSCGPSVGDEHGIVDEPLSTETISSPEMEIVPGEILSRQLSRNGFPGTTAMLAGACEMCWSLSRPLSTCLAGRAVSMNGCVFNPLIRAATTTTLTSFGRSGSDGVSYLERALCPGSKQRKSGVLSRCSPAFFIQNEGCPFGSYPT